MGRWLGLNLNALVHTEARVQIVLYEDWFEQPLVTVEKIARYLDLPYSRPELERKLAGIIASDLFHNRETAEIANPLAARLYEALRDFAAGACQADQLFAQACRWREAWLATLPSAWSLEIEVKRSRLFWEKEWDILKNISDLDAQGEEVKKALADLEAYVARLRRDRAERK